MPTPTTTEAYIDARSTPMDRALDRILHLEMMLRLTTEYAEALEDENRQLHGRLHTLVIIDEAGLTFAPPPPQSHPTVR